ncbi:hypothetical protein V1511DRAFT_479264 [Dipodascopsis uninucleata]
MDESEYETVLEDGFVPFPQVEVIAEDLPLEPKHKIISRLWHEEDIHTVGELSSEREKIRFHALCEACRAGDLEQVENLVSTFGVEVNATDEWDYTPLILASLCGHEHVVKYLLENGAICDRDTFQGERCLYGALTDSIRQLLLKFDISKAVDAVQPFAAHITSLLTKVEPLTSDIIFSTPSSGIEGSSNTQPEKFHLHRFVLTARSSYFKENLAERWRTKKVVKLSSSMDPRAFDVVVKYLYSVDVTIASAELGDLITKVARRLELPHLITTVENSKSQENFRLRRANRQDEMHRAQDDFENFCKSDVIERQFAVDRNTYYTKKDSLFEVPIESTADILIAVDECDRENDDLSIENTEVNADSRDYGNVILYPTHRAMLIRSEYFLTMFTSPFAEASFTSIASEDNPDVKLLPTVALRVSKEVAEIVLEYLYTDRVEIPRELALDVLYCADLLLLDKLKSLASIALTQGENEEDQNTSITETLITKKSVAAKSNSIYDILRAGWATRMDRLERFAAKYFAERLNYFIVQEEFADIVLESANRIRSRDETDTIELIDDIRFYLAQKYGILFEDDMDPISGKVQEGPYRRITMYERDYNAQLDLIEDLLTRLGLDA